jgi:hypothetical protein
MEEEILAEAMFSYKVIKRGNTIYPEIKLANRNVALTDLIVALEIVTNDFRKKAEEGINKSEFEFNK